MAGHKREVFLRITLIWLFFQLVFSACNYPGVRSTPSSATSKEIRQTLDAISKDSPTAPLISSEQPTGIPTQEPSPTSLTEYATPNPGVTPVANLDRFQYFSRSGDTLPALAARFQVEPALVLSSSLLPSKELIPAGTEIWVPNRVGKVPYPEAILPDSEMVNSPAALNFDLKSFIDQQGGYLSSYKERVQGNELSGLEIIDRVAMESSINPRLLLALIELRSGWVQSPLSSGADRKYPLGFHVSGWEGLYKELVIAATHLNAGYYGWREGTLQKLEFRDRTNAGIDPRLNPGTVAVQNVLAKLFDHAQFQDAIYGDGGFVSTYQALFGDPWAPEGPEQPIFPPGIAQPELELPFAPGLRWSLTGGPHPSWKTGSPRGGLDLAPVTGEPACAVSTAWVTAPASGQVVRSERNVVALDLDGDGSEQTGWVLIFLHIADHERVSSGLRLNLDDRIGHPSCEGGTSTGTHFHIARKYNGEWIAADGPLPFNLGGWQAYAGTKNYQGGMVNGEQEAVASPVGPRTSIIVR